jgi:exo-1,4-beta-D-glucosaminidase
MDSTYNQITRLRAHPSILVWLNGSDESPPPEVEKDFLAVLQEREWPNPVLSAAADRTSSITGKTGVKMSGPYDYVPPEYWYLDRDSFGGAFGFNTETSPGPSIPTTASIRRTLPRESWWPQDERWNYHAGLGKFGNYDRFNSAMAATYGAADSLTDYTLKAQLMAYDGERAMFEAYRADKYRSTGVIQWMLNNAWPSFIWHLYDYYLVPGGGYFGTRKANEPLHIQYRYDNRTIAVTNSTLNSYRGLQVSAKVIDLHANVIFSHNSSTDIPSDGVVNLFSIPYQQTTTFLRLELRDAMGKVQSESFYWLPARLADMNWDKSTYFYTPAYHYADMHDLASLPQASVTVSAHPTKQLGEAEVEIRNIGRSVAFFLALRAVTTGTDEDITPVFWEDNYISLLPGESRVLTVNGLPAAPNSEIELTGWNVSQKTVPVALRSDMLRNTIH